MKKRKEMARIQREKEERIRKRREKNARLAEIKRRKEFRVQKTPIFSFFTLNFFFFLKNNRRNKENLVSKGEQH